MIVGIREDFSTDVTLDSELLTIPSSGLYLNSGAHPSITLANLLAFLPSTDIFTGSWDVSKTYGVYSRSKSASDIVSVGGNLYQSIKEGDNKPPASNGDYWLKTNNESILLKSFIYSVLDKVQSELNLTKRLVNNQYIYEVGDRETTLGGDYAAWAIQPKGSDYVTIRINEIAFQKKGTTPVNLYVVNQGELLDTLQLVPNNGKLTFSAMDYELSGKGVFYLAIDSTDVLVGNTSIDPLMYDGFVAYTVTGDGNTPQDARFTYGPNGIGIGLNISAFLDASKYIENNISEFGNFIRATFELMVFQMFLQNPNNKSNLQTSIQMTREILLAELKNMNADTVVSRYYRERKKALKIIEKTFDTQLSDDEGIEISTGSL